MRIDPRFTAIGGVAISLFALALLPSAASAGERKDAQRAFAGFADIVRSVSDRVKPSVVHIEAIIKSDNRNIKVSGSGLVVAADGRIITNEHVVAKAQKIVVVLQGDERRYEARIVGADKQTDLAVIRLVEGPKKLSVAVFAPNDGVNVGDWVIAVGNPYGLDGTVSLGIVSAKGRNLTVGVLINEFIQTDAMIDHGSSGGPLVNLDGEVIGINSMAQGRGIGFTIPSGTVLRVMDRLHDEGDVDRAWLGVVVQPFGRDLAAYFGVTETTGVMVSQVIDRSPAQLAGIHVGDVIASIDGESLRSETDDDLVQFRRRIAEMKIGSTHRVGLLREGRRKDAADVTLGKQPVIEGEEYESELGITVEELTQGIQLDWRFPSDHGLFVSFVEDGTPASEAGIFQGDLIQAVNGVRIGTVADFRRMTSGHSLGKGLLIESLRGGSRLFQLVKPFGTSK